MKKRIQLDLAPLTPDEVGESLGISPSRRAEIRQIVEDAARRLSARRAGSKGTARKSVAKQAA